MWVVIGVRFELGEVGCLRFLCMLNLASEFVMKTFCERDPCQLSLQFIYSYNYGDGQAYDVFVVW